MWTLTHHLETTRHALTWTQMSTCKWSFMTMSHDGEHSRAWTESESCMLSCSNRLDTTEACKRRHHTCNASADERCCSDCYKNMAGTSCMGFAAGALTTV